MPVASMNGTAHLIYSIDGLMARARGRQSMLATDKPNHITARFPATFLAAKFQKACRSAAVRTRMKTGKFKFLYTSGFSIIDFS